MEGHTERGAWLSEDGLYRYDLWRRWGGGPWVLWVMLNPSTADAEVDDPTTRRCVGFSKAWGYGGMAIVNLFAYRATSPAELAKAPDPRGPLNMQTIEHWLVFDEVELVVAAWGASWAKVPHARLNVEWLASKAGHDMVSLGTTKAGHPRHPLYVRGDQTPTRWPEG